MKSKRTARFLTAMATTLVLLGVTACKKDDTTSTTPPAPGASAPSDMERARPGLGQEPAGAPVAPSSNPTSP
jgi:hypothetical protein